ncbi:helix-turn-helix transcriptional regulator [Virgisporangium aurantiacum]|uniref:Helix-turn-helix transcriptional regulator n=1 Tax=Virgisporangium aurantiacum TaxID=175570 RepID=A0A8J3ZCR6_9ACTN|nr:LuxR C-terminal-related transcriptional regulator [Virgisporangium aurantiacum]GIJ60438.1 helix-turn-helix transcriptional regulator [Virgisporangium aurantiacum]
MTAVGLGGTGTRPVFGPHVRAALDAVSPDAWTGVCVQAPGGSGKTTLIREFTARCDAAGIPVLTPWPTVPESVDDGAVLLVDDAHLLDTAQLDALRHLVRRCRPRLVLTCRPWPRPPALVELIAVVSRTHPPLTLPPFTAHEVGTYLATVWAEPPPPSVVEHIHAQTGGVPAFVARHALWGAPSGPALRHPPAEFLALFTAEIDALDPDVRRVLLATEAGMGLRMDLLGALLDRDPDGVATVLEAARATGLLGRDGELVPVVGSAIRTVVPLAHRIAVWQRLIDLQLDRGAPVLPLVRALLDAGGSAADSAMAAAFEAGAHEAMGSDPALAARMFAAAATAGRPTVVAQARAAALAGDLDGALRLADQVMADPGSPERSDGAVMAATALAHRGQLARSAELFQWSGHGSAAAEFAAIGLVGSARLADAEKMLRDGPTADSPTLLAGAAELTARGVHESVCAAPTVALSTLVQAATLLESAGDQTPLPDSPAALAALVGMHGGDLDIGEAVLLRAMAGDVGGALLATRHRLLHAWLLMMRGDIATARVELAAVGAHGDRLEPRDLIFSTALAVGLARRNSDLVALHRAWPDACRAVIQHPVDLFMLLPLGEFAVAAARIGQQRWIANQLRDAWALLEDLNSPPLWTVQLHWACLHAAVISEQRTEAAAHAAALDTQRWYSPFVAAVASAAACWLAVLTGRVDQSQVETAARALHASGLSWDGARLAGQAAIRTTDRRVMTSLLDCARVLQGRQAPTEPNTGAPSPGARPPRRGEVGLSPREHEVATLVLAGLTYREIGDRLFIAAKTVEHHMARMRQRLGCASRSELLAHLRVLTDDGAESRTSLERESP